MNHATPTKLLQKLRTRRCSPRQRKPGDAPGALVFEGAQRVDEILIEATDYGPQHLEEETISRFEDCRRFLGRENPTWLHVTGVHDVEKISEAGQIFEIPKLLLEDLLNTEGRAKVELFEDSLFVQIKVLEMAQNGKELEFQQLSIFMGPQTLISFCEGPTRVFDPIFRRLKNAQGRLRQRGLDYLLWALLDTVVDHAVLSLSLLERNLVEIDKIIQEDHTAITASELYAQKHEIMSIQQQIRPNRELIHTLRHAPPELLSADLASFFDELRDHSVLLSDECDALRDYAASIRDYLLAEMNQRMNNVMKVLTCISTIFLPLTFLAGVYGMNFREMPELTVPWAYPLLWAIFLGVAVFLIVLFRRKKWL